jgi:hypothetical protein
LLDEIEHAGLLTVKESFSGSRIRVFLQLFLFDVLKLLVFYCLNTKLDAANRILLLESIGMDWNHSFFKYRYHSISFSGVLLEIGIPF